MTSSVLSSTFLLTLLLLVGLLFFIRASVKDRTQIVRLVSEQKEDTVLPQLQHYFAQRSYQIRAMNEAHNQIALEGFVRPSLFLASFLTMLAAIGILCLALVLCILLPSFAIAWLGFVLFAPLAGIFYWRRAGRPEKVLLKVEAATGPCQEELSVITVAAHRDEVAEFRRAFPFKQVEE
ncbi:MAG: cofactor assembly of complex C subunit B [Kovacikia sp.]